MAVETTATIIPDDATHEEIEEAVDQILEQRSTADLAADETVDGEETSDAEKVGTGESVTERNNGEDTAEGDNVPSGEKTGKGKSDNWRKDAKAEAAAYGVSDEELAEFTSREELDRALNLFDRQLDAEREKLDGDQTGEDDDPNKGESQEDGQGSGPEDGQSEATYEVRLDEDIYDEELVDEFTRMRDHYEGRIAALEERFTNADSLAAEQSFDRNVDALEFSKMFGKTGEESGAELDRRKELYEQVQIEQLVMSRLGRSVDHDALVRRVARSLYPDEYDKKLIRNHTRRISRQHNMRQGGGATRPSDPPETLGEEMRQLYGELEHQSG